MRRWLHPSSTGALAVTLLLAACASGGGPAGPTTFPAAPTTASVPPASTSAPSFASTVPTSAVAPMSTSSTTALATTALTTTVPAPSTTVVLPASTEPSTEPSSEPSSVPARLVDVKVYLWRDEHLAIAHRSVVRPAVLRGALAALLEGPTPAERQASLTSAVPAGTTLLDVALAGGLATVDLSVAFASGGGTLSMQARLAQVVFTATQFANVDRVVFRLDGKPLEVLGGEGLVVGGPQRRMDSPHLLTGAVLIDTPAYGATVGRTFTVTGEGDVYEGEFSIAVFAAGRRVGGADGVRTGAWGTWAPFSVTLTVDAPAGPIRLVASDVGACGDDPGCPPLARTEVPLTLVG